jgi:hypothetical protein
MRQASGDRGDTPVTRILEARQLAAIMRRRPSGPDRPQAHTNPLPERTAGAMLTPDRVAIAIIFFALGCLVAAMMPTVTHWLREVINELMYYLMRAMIVGGGCFFVYLVLHFGMHKI